MDDATRLQEEVPIATRPPVPYKDSVPVENKNGNLPFQRENGMEQIMLYRGGFT
jgi:hypothetical protein